MPDNMSGTVCIVKNKAALLPSAGGHGSEPHSTYLYTYLGLPTGMSCCSCLPTLSLATPLCPSWPHFMPVQYRLLK